MPKIEYVPRSFSASSQAVIRHAQSICDEYAAQGYTLTLRQLYYQFVARDLIPNTQRDYKRLGDIINNARLAGLIDWRHLTDRTRNVQSNSHWGSPEEIIQSCVHSFAIDKWQGMEHRVEVWIEKDALVGVIADVCETLDVPYFSCRGYVSQSEMWGAAMRLLRWQQDGQRPVIVHLGDHDPSGIDMTRDIEDRLQVFECDAIVNRIALTRAQIDEYQPPPNPAKITDSRAPGYIAAHGNESWELDALEPRVMSDLISKTVTSYRDEDVWNRNCATEADFTAQLSEVQGRWDDVVDYLRGDR